MAILYGSFDPARRWDRYQVALRELVEAKMKGLATAPRAIAEPPKVINLMEASKRSLAQDAEPEPEKAAASRPHVREGCSQPVSTGAPAADVGWS